MFDGVLTFVKNNAVFLMSFIFSCSLIFSGITVYLSETPNTPEYKQDIITVEKHKYIVLYTEKSSHLIHSESCECLKKELRFYEDYVKRINEAWRQVR